MPFFMVYPKIQHSRLSACKRPSKIQIQFIKSGQKRLSMRDKRCMRRVVQYPVIKIIKRIGYTGNGLDRNQTAPLHDPLQMLLAERSLMPEVASVLAVPRS